MIILKNGDKWIIDEEETKDLDYEEACKGNVPLTEIKDFIKKLCKAYEHDNDCGDENVDPRKLTDRFEGGYWDCNFDVFKEVFGSVAVSVITNPWSTVYKMPWNDFIVVFAQADCGGYDVETAIKVYNCYADYLLDVTMNQ